MPACRRGCRRIGATTICSSARRWSRRARRTRSGGALLDALDAADWAPHFLHLRGLVEDGPVHRGLRAARHGAASTARSAPSSTAISARTLITSRPSARRSARSCAACATASPSTARSKLASSTTAQRSTPGADPISRWKRRAGRGEAGTALAGDPRTDAFFRAALAAAWDEGRLQFLRLDVAGRPIAMLVNFLSAPGSFSFKTVFDEDHARFSPGVLIQIENLAHSRRSRHQLDGQLRGRGSPDDRQPVDRAAALVRVSVPLKGARRFPAFAASRALEDGWRMLKRLRGRR